jgi:hypothetical protein
VSVNADPPNPPYAKLVIQALSQPIATAGVSGNSIQLAVGCLAHAHRLDGPDGIYTTGANGITVDTQHNPFNFTPGSAATVSASAGNVSVTANDVATDGGSARAIAARSGASAFTLGTGAAMATNGVEVISRGTLSTLGGGSHGRRD